MAHILIMIDPFGSRMRTPLFKNTNPLVLAQAPQVDPTMLSPLTSMGEVAQEITIYLCVYFPFYPIHAINNILEFIDHVIMCMIMLKFKPN